MMNANKKILWGAASNAYQIEGYGDSGKGRSIMDMTMDRELMEVSSDHYHHYEEDIRLMKEMGVQSYYMSIAWSRVIPDGNGEVSEQGIDYYRRLLTCLKENGISPVVTLVHFDLPYALVEAYNGWHSRRIIDDFVRYCEVCYRAFGDLVAYWIPISGLNAECQNPKFNGGCDNPQHLEEWTFRVAHIKLLAHAKAIDLCHRLCPHALAGSSLEHFIVYPKTCQPKDTMTVFYKNAHDSFFYYDTMVNGEYPKLGWRYLEKKGICPKIEEGDLDILKKGKPDFLGAFYYESMTVQWCCENASRQEGRYNLSRDGVKGGRILPKMPGLYEAVENEYLTATDWDWTIDPVGFYLCMYQLYDRYHLPLLIAENGFGCAEQPDENGMVQDDQRIAFHRSHIQELLRAMDDGIEIIGYHIWSAVDLMSTSNGFGKRYGLIYINRDDEDVRDLKRIPKKSYYWYRDVILSDGESVWE